MKIYGHPMSGGTRLVLLAAAEKKIPHEHVVLDFAKGTHKQPEHLARQPFGKIPAMEHEGLKLFESRAIARYIGEAFPGESFIPTDARERALVDQWVSAEMMEFFPVAHQLVLQLVIFPAMGMGAPDAARVEDLRTNLAPVLAVLDRALEGKSYLVGNKFTLADMVYMPDLEYLHAGGEGDRIAKFPNVTRWWKGLSTRQTWRKVTGAKD
jgi:glutathione S-transferase